MNILPSSPRTIQFLTFIISLWWEAHYCTKFDCFALFYFFENMTTLILADSMSDTSLFLLPPSKRNSSILKNRYSRLLGNATQSDNRVLSIFIPSDILSAFHQINQVWIKSNNYYHFLIIDVYLIIGENAAIRAKREAKMGNVFIFSKHFLHHG
jgi:hypothetical protein